MVMCARGPMATVEGPDSGGPAAPAAVGTVPAAVAVELLATGTLTWEGALAGASNATIRAICRREDASVRCVVKPVAGERPLWDFPVGTLSAREVAAYEVSVALGWSLVPPTVWREDTEVGAAMVQLWVAEDPHSSAVRVVAPDEVPPGWAAILEGHDQAGAAVVLIHALNDRMEKMAVFDAVINNGDRKGGHVISDSDGVAWAIDHGVSLSVEPKLRGVLWGWAGEPISESVLRDLRGFQDLLACDSQRFDVRLTVQEQVALRERVDTLVASGMHPLPSGEWPAIPWPIM
jgi:uncharacterized repeat protein (TIGR03843 family)